MDFLEIPQSMFSFGAFTDDNSSCLTNKIEVSPSIVNY